MGNFRVRFVTQSFFFLILTRLDNGVNLSNYSEEETISNFVGRVYHDKLLVFLSTSNYVQGCAVD